LEAADVFGDEDDVAEADGPTRARGAKLAWIRAVRFQALTAKLGIRRALRVTHRRLPRARTSRRSSRGPRASCPTGRRGCGPARRRAGPGPIPARRPARRGGTPRRGRPRTTARGRGTGTA